MSPGQNTEGLHPRLPIADVSALTAAGISPDSVASLLPLLDAVASLADAEAAVLSNAGSGFHSLLLAVRLSRGLMKVVIRQMEHWVVRADIPTTHIVTLKHAAPLFVISTPLPPETQASVRVLSLLTTGQSLPTTCSFDKIEGVAVCMAALLANQEHRPQINAWVGVRKPSQPLCCCCMCAGIETENGGWLPWQTYLEEKIGRDLSHTYCPACLTKSFPEAREMLA